MQFERGNTETFLRPPEALIAREHDAKLRFDHAYDWSDRLATRNIRVGSPLNGAITTESLKTIRAVGREEADKDQPGHYRQPEHAADDFNRRHGMRVRRLRGHVTVTDRRREFGH